MADDRLHRAIDGIYAASLDTTRWSGVASQVAACLDTASAFLHTRSTEVTLPLSVTANVDERALALYGEHFAARDPWVAGWHRRGGGTGIFLGSDLVAPSALAASEFYCDYAKNLGLFHQVGAVTLASPNVALLVAIHRPISDEAFAGKDQHRLGLLLPHITRSLQVRTALERAEHARDAALTALDRLTIGVVLVDQNEKVVFANTAAEFILRTDGAISVRDGRLRVTQPSQAAPFHQALRAAIALAHGRLAHAPQALRLPRPQRRPLSLLVAPLPLERRTLPAQAWAVVFLSDPDKRQVPPAALLAAQYHLTPAQARMLEALLEGERVADYAAKVGVSQNTALTHLKQIFLKTGTTRQSELVAQCLRDLTGGLVR